MRNRAAAILSSALIAFFFALLWGCGSDSGNLTKPDPDPDPDPDPSLSHEWTPGLLGLPPADSAVLDSAASRFRALRQTGDAASARTALVAALTGGWEGVANAGVTVDGSTVQINFSDGVKALIVTDELFQTGGGEQAAGSEGDGPALAGGQKAGTRSSDCLSIAGASADVGCAEAAVSPHHQVRIVNPAPATSSSAGGVSTQVRQDLSLLGWDDEDIEVRQSTGRLDRSFTPDEILHQAGAGVVIFNAQGAAVSMGSGSPTGGGDVAFAMQAFNAGSYEEYQEKVTAQRWGQYEQWQKDGRLIHGKVWSPSTQTMVDQVFIREDLLAEEIELAENATVHFISPGSARMGNLERMVSRGGAASATGWDGFISSSEAANSIGQLISNMATRDEGPRSQAAAVALLHDQGLTTLTGGGGESHLLVEVKTEDPLFLPAQMRFDAPESCRAVGSVSYEVEVDYPDCPAMRQSFQVVPGTRTSVTGLPPVGARVNFRAKDAAGNTIGAGRYDLDLSGGPNDLDLCPCEGKLDMDFLGLGSVPGIDAGAQITGRIDYTDSSIPSQTFTMDVATLGDSEEVLGMPGEGKLTYTLTDGAGRVLGYSENQDVELRCDTPENSTPSFGWFKFTPGRTWSRTDSLFITGTSNDPSHEPFSFALIPGSGTTQVGLRVSDTIQILVVAETEEGEVLDSLEFEQVVQPGENEVAVEFDSYGVILTASSPLINANGETVTLTATVRGWVDGDTDDPTGPVVEDVEVTLTTDIGNFLTASTGLSDSNGEFSATMESYVSGTATIIATVGGLAESNPVEVILRGKLRIIIDGRAGDVQDTIPSPAIGWPYYHLNCAHQTLEINDFLYFDGPLGGDVWTYFRFERPFVGDTLHFEWTPRPSCPDPAAPSPDSLPYISPVYLHYFFGVDFDNQITVLVTAGATPLLSSITKTIPLVDPTAPDSAPPPSPFDLAAVERYVLSGFQEMPPARTRSLRE